MSTEEMTTQNEAKDSLTVYEVGFLLLPTIAEEKLPEALALIRSAIEAKEGTLIAEDFPKMRALSYPISKVIATKRHAFDHAYFGWVKFETSASHIASLQKHIESLAEVLRALFIKTVRENTLMSGKVLTKEASKPKTEEGEVAVVSKVQANEEEIDKSIDALVIS